MEASGMIRRKDVWDAYCRCTKQLIPVNAQPLEGNFAKFK
jgi:hypothetical protein